MAGPDDCQGIDNLHKKQGNYILKGDNTADASSRKRRLNEISNVTDDDCGLSPTFKLLHPDIEQNPSKESADENELRPLFEPNERCFAMGDETGDVYLGKIKQVAQLASGKKGPRWKYLIHYNGWNSRFDQWIMEEDVFPDNEHYRAISEKTQTQLREMEQCRKDNKSRAEKEMKRTFEMRRSNDSRSQTEETPKKMRGRPPKEQWSMQESCELPMTLKIVLVDEQSYINRLGKTSSFTGYDRVSDDPIPARKLHDLPSSITVHRILKQFARSVVKSKKAVEAKDNDTVESTSVDYAALQQNCKDFASYLSNLFDAMLPKFILYGFERAQYLSLNSNKDKGSEAEGAAFESDISMSSVYSGEFLLRMIVRLPYILSVVECMPKLNKSPGSHTNGGNEHGIFSKWNAKYKIEGKEFAKLVSELVVFLQKNRDKIFKGKYRECQVDEFTSNESRFADKLGKK